MYCTLREKQIVQCRFSYIDFDVICKLFIYYRPRETTDSRDLGQRKHTARANNRKEASAERNIIQDKKSETRPDYRSRF